MKTSEENHQMTKLRVSEAQNHRLQLLQSPKSQVITEGLRMVSKSGTRLNEIDADEAPKRRQPKVLNICQTAKLSACLRSRHKEKQER